MFLISNPVPHNFTSILYFLFSVCKFIQILSVLSHLIGNLYFANVAESDGLGDARYRCLVRNRVLRGRTRDDLRTGITKGRSQSIEPQLTGGTDFTRITPQLSRVSYQIVKIAGCACAGNARNVFPATDFKGNRQLAIPVCITARASRTCLDACRDS